MSVREMRELIARARADAIETGRVEIDGETYEYDVVPALFVATVPYFVMYPLGERLLISEQVPLRYRTGFCSSEVRHFGKGDSYTMAEAIEQELAFIDPDDAVDYLTMRMLSFDATIKRTSHGLLPKYTAQLESARDAFKRKISELAPVRH